MSATGSWIIEMGQDCVDMTKEEFCKKYGEKYSYIFDEFIVDLIAEAEENVKH